jgi:hypothetical protein
MLPPQTHFNDWESIDALSGSLATCTAGLHLSRFLARTALPSNELDHSRETPFTSISPPPYLRSRNLKVRANLARKAVVPLAVAWNRPGLAGGIRWAASISHTNILTIFCPFSIAYRH